MSHSENNRIKHNSGNLFKGFDRKRKRSNGLDDSDKKKILSNYLPYNKNKNEEANDHKPVKTSLDFSKLFHKKIQQEPTVFQNGTEIENKCVENFLGQYEQLRMEYQQEGMSQSSILLLQRTANTVNKNPRYPNIDQSSVLKDLFNISK